MEGGKLHWWEKAYWVAFAGCLGLLAYNHLPGYFAKEAPKVDEEKEARKREAARMVLAGHSLLDSEDDPFDGLSPEVRPGDVPVSGAAVAAAAAVCVYCGGARGKRGRNGDGAAWGRGCGRALGAGLGVESAGVHLPSGGGFGRKCLRPRLACTRRFTDLRAAGHCGVRGGGDAGRQRRRPVRGHEPRGDQRVSGGTAAGDPAVTACSPHLENLAPVVYSSTEKGALSTRGKSHRDAGGHAPLPPGWARARPAARESRQPCASGVGNQGQVGRPPGQGGGDAVGHARGGHDPNGIQREDVGPESQAPRRRVHEHRLHQAGQPASGRGVRHGGWVPFWDERLGMEFGKAECAGSTRPVSTRRAAKGMQVSRLSPR